MGKEERPVLGTYLKSLRDAKGLTLRDVEDKTGISNGFLSQLESGKVREPSPVMLYKLARLYEVPYQTLMDRAGYPVPEGNEQTARKAYAVFNRLGNITEDEEMALLDYLGFIRARGRREGRKK